MTLDNLEIIIKKNNKQIKKSYLFSNESSFKIDEEIAKKLKKLDIVKINKDLYSMNIKDFLTKHKISNLKIYSENTSDEYAKIAYDYSQNKENYHLVKISYKEKFIDFPMKKNILR